MEELFAFLTSFPDAPVVTEEFRSYISSRMSVRHYKPREFLHLAGRINAELYFIVDGLVRVFVEGLDNKEHVIFIAKKSEIIASSESYERQEPSDENFQALLPTTALVMDYKELEYIYRHFLEFNFHARIITKGYATHFYSLHKLMKTQSAWRRYQFLVERFSDLLPLVAAKHLASYIGVSKTTFSLMRRGKYKYR